MQNYYHSLPTGDNLPEEVNVVIEISEGSYMKYEYDHELGIMVLDRVNYAPMAFPTNYGFIPQCWNNDDGDPADALVIASYPIHSNTMVPCRVIGMLHMIDGGELDDKIICVPVDDKNFEHVDGIQKLAPHFMKQIEHYFNFYKKIVGKEVTVEEFQGKEEAFKHIHEGIAAHKEKFGE